MAEKLIGPIGGMSWESSSLYYQLLNREVQRRLGGQHNARSVLFTLDFEELDQAAGAGNWGLVADRVADAAQRLEAAGADFVLITSVTGHIVYDDVQRAIGVPLLHIADAVQGKLGRGASVGLLGTKFTLSMPHLSGPLEALQGLRIVTPGETQRAELQRIISDELQHGEIRPASQETVKGIARSLGEQGAEAVILGCTELPLLMDVGEYPIRTLNLVQLHVEAAVEMALAG
jgi:aspartate racemase